MKFKKASVMQQARIIFAITSVVVSCIVVIIVIVTMLDALPADMGPGVTISPLEIRQSTHPENAIPTVAPQPAPILKGGS